MLEDNNNKIQSMLKNLEEKESKVENFSELLENLQNVDPKRKILWKEIYENALDDRTRAGILFTEAYVGMSGNSDHLALGATMAKYLERMSKSNDQILQLAELIRKSEEDVEKITPDALYNQILND